MNHSLKKWRKTVNGMSQTFITSKELSWLVILKVECEDKTVEGLLLKSVSFKQGQQKLLVVLV